MVIPGGWWNSAFYELDPLIRALVILIEQFERAHGHAADQAAGAFFHLFRAPILGIAIRPMPDFGQVEIDGFIIAGPLALYSMMK